MVRRRAGSWTVDVESNTSNANMIGRRSNAQAGSPSSKHQLPLTEGDDSATAKSPKLKTHASKMRICGSYRGTVVTLSAAVLYFLVRTKSLFSQTAADPCQVARETAETLQRLRLDGRTFDKSFSSDWKPELPKIIHHQWKDDNIPDKYKEWHQQWYKLYPDYTHMLWTDESARQLIQEHYSWFLNTYDSYDYPIKRADAARYFYLHYYGGLHTDLDYEPLSREIFQHLPQDRVALVESPYKFSEETQNSMMTSPKNDPFWLDVFELLQKHKDKRVLAATGPQLMDVALRNTQHAVHILPCENFHRIPLGERQHSPFVTDMVREVFGRMYPMKQCGRYDDTACHFARHHNTAVYVTESTWWELIWKM